MATDVPTVARLYIADAEKARKSVIHTIYAGAGGPVQPGIAQQPLHKLEFVFGVARHIPTQEAQRFIDLGHATTERPKSTYEEAEERDILERR
jgi:hypothetical protein